MQSQEDGRYKIGTSKHSPQRVNELQTGNSSEIKLISVFQSEYANHIERTLQRKYSYARKKGEWFELYLENEQTFTKDCKEIEANVMFLKDSNNPFI